ncbi:hypothetical protein [Neisseria chenwenguii]|uniref:Uncharacterized protein n=1 Tax=Neisseria chenwenguii TaxID=1853278 RepID=A0A220S0B5_9NEIS|nr:hypothetical protein [Neisseria chenwenguii]ASK26828.1 hypothetical protein BG910_02905 [Neisseria chenwenguii]ROV56806.1 hypothetical protein EGS38_02920 [Neisseria chenwenguii]
MLRGFFTFLVLLVSLPALAAQRDLPADINVAVLKKVELPYLELGNGGVSWIKILTLGLVDGKAQKFQISRFARIKDENDRYTSAAKLQTKTGRPIAVKRDAAGVIREVWVLHDEESAVFAAQAAQRQGK